MNNAANWGVKPSRIQFLDRVLSTHGNVRHVIQHDEIVFEAMRAAPGDQLTILCCDEYTMGITSVYRALREFGKLDIIFVGGVWCGYTREAKEYCTEAKIGLYNSNELNGALWREEHWSYYQRDKDGNRIYHYR